MEGSYQHDLLTSNQQTPKHKMKLLSTNSKLEKSVHGYILKGVALAPHKIARRGNVCPWAGDCAKTCIWTSGLNKMPSAQASKIARTEFFFMDRKAFIAQLSAEITIEKLAARQQNKKLAVRLNLFSDILWEQIAPELFSTHPDVQFYDYTKAPAGVRTPPANYRLTYSYSERSTPADVAHYSQRGSIAVVFQDKLPKRWNKLKVFNADLNDARFKDKTGTIAGLVPKNGLSKVKSRFKV